MDSGAWWATVHGVAKSRTQLSDLTLLNVKALCNERLTKNFIGGELATEKC